MEQRFASTTDMRGAIAGKVVDLLPAPGSSAEVPFVVQLQEEPSATAKPSRIPPAGVTEGVDPFAPLPDKAPISLLENRPDRPPPLPQVDHPIELARPAWTSAETASRRRAVLEPTPPHRRLLLGIVLGLLALIVVARVAYTFLRPASEKNAPTKPRVQHRVTLALDPSEASVQIDQLPAMRDDLFLDEGSPHVLLASAPGRITRRFTIEAKTDMELSLHLGRTLALPLATDPEPLRSELAVAYPANPATRDEINRAFAKLDRYARCLILLGYGDGDGDARRGATSTVPKSSDTSVCVQLVDEANTLAPEMFPLRAAGTAYFQAVQNGQSSTALR
ncbi:MAG TPA: hypothetical protein VIM14_02145, partial [Polyangia bacterium]